MITAMTFTKNDTLITGGIDSNIKIWRGLESKTVVSEYTFLKHVDKIVYIRTFFINNEEFVLSGDLDGVVYYWKVNSYKAERYLALDEYSIMDGNDTLMFTLNVQDSSVVLKKFSFNKRSTINAVVIRYFEGDDEMKVRA